ncbi:hypothetical protein D7X25_22760 [bacterium 1XD42-8]|jgi:hypothetical protein|nr:hypothetical protein [Lachnospiraceae bacterium]RKJ47335.1 hypothetical protein D7X25_22760 [bacterium 1XD42-8]
MIRAEYKKDLNNHFLIIKDDEMMSKSYQAKMMTGNLIQGLLPCRLRYMNGQAEFCYEIGSKEALGKVYENQEIQYDMLHEFFEHFLQMMKELDTYLLDSSCIILDKDFIFLNLEKKQWYFCFFPKDDKDGTQTMHSFAEYILSKVDHKDKNAVMLAYDFYKFSMKEYISIKEFETYLYTKKKEMLKEQEDFLINEKSNENIDFKEGDWEMEPKEEIEGEGWEKERKKRWLFLTLQGADIILFFIYIGFYFQQKGLWSNGILGQWNMDALTFRKEEIIVMIGGVVLIGIFILVWMLKNQPKSLNNEKEGLIKEDVIL